MFEVDSVLILNAFYSLYVYNTLNLKKTIVDGFYYSTCKASGKKIVVFFKKSIRLLMNLPTYTSNYFNQDEITT